MLTRIYYFISIVDYDGFDKCEEYEIKLLIQSVIQSCLVRERISKMTESDSASLTFITISLSNGRYQSLYRKLRDDKKRVMNI
jgi:hypothetical protein